VISINIYEIIMQMVNFLILLYLLNRFLIKPLSEFVESRSAGIKSDIDNAKKNKNDSQALLDEQKQLLNDARQEAKSIREKAEQSSVVERDQILQNAKKRVSTNVNSGKKRYRFSC
jgi:F-type H+-transporting ATPase subunit b